MQGSLNSWEDVNDGDSDIEVVDCKKPIVAKIERKRKMPKIKRSNPHSNLDEDYINRREKLMHPQWDTLDPTPDTLALFKHVDGKFFQGRLKSVTLDWSKHMKSCAGISYCLRHGRDVTIRLSEPLLKARARKDLVNTMLHQMIHAYLFLLKINENNNGHGPYFKKIMLAINKVAGTTITCNHMLNHDWNQRQLHWWRCNGICQNRAPFFGYVLTERLCAPDSDVQWYTQHQELCGGTFMRIKSPESTEHPMTKQLETNIKNKRRRLSGEGNTRSQNWEAVDEEVMLQVHQETVITLSSDEEEEEDSHITNGDYNGMCQSNMSNEQKLEMIKQEIIEESLDLNINDFELIADVTDSNNNAFAESRSADTRTVEQYFSDNTLLMEFKNDNDCRPSTSRHEENVGSDIVKCFICEDKLSRRDYGQHLNGCAGISRKILPHRKALQKLSAISKEPRPRRPIRRSSHTTRDILRNAGYTEAELSRITSAEETEDDGFATTSIDRRSSTTGSTNSTAAVNSIPEVLNISSEDEHTIQYRQRNLHKTTRECPVCTEDVEELLMNTHLDICLLVKKQPRRTN